MQRIEDESARQARALRAAAGLLITAVLAAAHAAADVRYVRVSASGANDGSSWQDAFTDLQVALALAAPGDEIWVAAGTHTTETAASSFVLPDGVGIYGGFAGTETSREQRDWVANPTILSGDVGHDDEYGSQVWYIGWNIHTDNCDNVVIAGNVGPGTVLDGFTITAGHGAYTQGAGLKVDGGSPTIANCTFLRNETGWGAGAGMYVADGSPTITNCNFTQNWCHICSGAGLYVTGSGSPSITDCTFTENHATADSGMSGQGSAIFLYYSAPVTIERCAFQYNITEQFNPFSGIEIARGGGISAFFSEFTARDCVFHHNSASVGGGIAAWNSATLINCVFWANTAVWGGAGDSSAGAVLCISYNPVTLTMVNCTLAGNTAGEAAAFEAVLSAGIAVRNCIIWGNTATGQDVAPRDRQFKGNATLFHSCVQDLLTAPPGEDPYDPADYPGSFDADPLFVNRPAGDLHLADGSPCLDAGRNSYVPAGVTTDLDGLARFYDDPLAPNVGDGTPPIVDMGPYERQPEPCPGDLDGDGDVDLADLSALLTNFGTAAGAAPEDGDIDGDGDVDLADLSELLTSYGASC
ncbi:MAG: right-handed parallel beta-helix repeat-containing protein [Phycisphaerae bacterium]